MSNTYINLKQKSSLSSSFNVKMTIRDVIYITYAIPAKRLRSLALVPKNLKLATINGDTAFISLVILRSTGVRLSNFPVVMFHYNQFNIRTYITDPVSSQNAVYFIRSGVTSRFIALVTNVLRIPWHYIELKTQLVSSNDLKFISINGNWEGQFSIKAQTMSQNIVTLPLFGNREMAINFLIRPLIGFIGDDKHLGRFTIYHPKIQPENWLLTELNCPIFNKLISIDDLMNTHSVFYLYLSDFSIFLPPSKTK